MRSILIDTREQDPFYFHGCPIEKKKLDFGDYSIHGFKQTVAVERKGPLDFANSVSRWDEFIARTRKARDRLRHYLVIIERLPTEAELYRLFPGMLRILMLQKIAEIASINIPVILTTSKEEGATVTKFFLMECTRENPSLMEKLDEN